MCHVPLSPIWSIRARTQTPNEQHLLCSPKAQQQRVHLSCGALAAIHGYNARTGTCMVSGVRTTRKFPVGSAADLADSPTRSIQAYVVLSCNNLNSLPSSSLSSSKHPGCQQQGFQKLNSTLRLLPLLEPASLKVDNPNPQATNLIRCCTRLISNSNQQKLYAGISFLASVHKSPRLPT
uniref:Uncharacterized protein n=1 Tax=Ananas comosus var. bracteatus TaxID=296719 RepID=A0A6V7P8N7_ANACO|nr:unnamed protein product [Ananas comosus var. bracteatus]